MKMTDARGIAVKCPDCPDGYVWNERGPTHPARSSRPRHRPFTHSPPTETAMSLDPRPSSSRASIADVIPAVRRHQRHADAGDEWIPRITGMADHLLEVAMLRAIVITGCLP